MAGSRIRPGERSAAPRGYWVALGFLFLCLVLSLLAAAPGFGAALALTAAPGAPTVTLADGWWLRTADGLAAGGAELSRPGFDTAGWTPTRVPATVLAALVKNGEVQDPYFGKNLDAIAKERFAVPWWYRTELALAQPLPAEARLVFHGINYEAEVWLNGEKVAGRDQVSGAFRTFELDVGSRLRAGDNALAVQVFPPRPGHFTIGFVDWNPRPPDANMGIWREVELRRTGGVSVDDVFVRSDLELPSLATAKLALGARVRNHTGAPRQVTLRGRFGDAAFEHPLTLAAGEDRELLLTPAQVPQLLVRSPRVWWPNNLGEPHLYELTLEAAVDGEVSDRRAVTFGIRQVGDYVDQHGRGYLVNGKQVLVRGGGWVDDLLLADDARRLEDQIRYVEHLNLNTIRLEGFWGSDHQLYDLADRHGIMVWVGWSCHWEWESYLGAPVDETFGGIDTEEEMALILASWRDQVVRLRNHPSVVVWNLASDMLPKPELERGYRAMLQQIDPTRPPLAACSVRTSEVSGPTAVKMNGPYEWVPPNYWYLDKERGGAHGFNTETGPGAQPPPAASIRRMMPQQHWWPIDAMWDFHSGRGEFKDLKIYNAALAARYGKPTDLDDYARRAQAANYEAMRAMFEAFSLRRPVAKGVVQWMLNSAWPDMFWQLYDWYLVPNGAYFAARNANQPLHVAYDYGERKVVAVNDTGAALRGAKVRVRVYDAASRLLLDESAALAVPAGERVEVLVVAPFATLAKSRAAATGKAQPAPVYFLDARIEGAGGAVLARNFYWLPAEDDVLDWQGSKWFYTPTQRYADLRALAALPPAPVEVTHRFAPADNGEVAVHATLRNPSDRIAFFVELSVLGGASRQLAAPIFWDDNYVSLLPGETREVRGSFPAHALGSEAPVFHYHGFNVAAPKAGEEAATASRGASGRGAGIGGSTTVERTGDR
jgi:exo-1,4-beta-D-glucosaminidase